MSEPPEYRHFAHRWAAVGRAAGRSVDDRELPGQGDDRLHHGAVHDDHRRHDGQRRPADDGEGFRGADHRHRVDRRRLPPHVRRRDPGSRLARRPVRYQACVHDRVDRVRRDVTRLRAVADPRPADPVPSAAGRRRRPGHPGRRGDALPGVLDGGPREGGDRRAQRGGDRTSDRPDARRASSSTPRRGTGSS